MNFRFLSALYFLTRPQAAGEDRAPDEALVPAGLPQLVKEHPYTAAYAGARTGYDFLEEKIDSPERLRSYTDLLEKATGLFRKGVAEARAGRRHAYHEALADLAEGISKPGRVDCARECFGLPRGTKLFQVDLPAFRLQIAELDGRLKIVSALPSSP